MTSLTMCGHSSCEGLAAATQRSVSQAHDAIAAVTKAYGVPICSTCGDTRRVDWDPGQQRHTEDDQQECPDCARPHRLVPLFIQLKTRDSPGWEYFATMPARYPWGCLDCDHHVVMTHAQAVEKGLARCQQL